MTLKDLFQRYVNMSDSERADHARQAIIDIADYCDEQGISSDNKTTLLVSMFKMFVSADMKCSYREKNLFNEAFGLNFSQDDFYEMTNHGSDSGFVYQMKDIISSMSDEAKANVIILGLCVVAADDTITPEEQRLLASLL